MCFDKIGFRKPETCVSESVHIYLENGMHYERMHDDIGLIAAADNEDVGQVTYYRLDAADWNDLVDGDTVEIVANGTPYVVEEN